MIAVNHVFNCSCDFRKKLRDWLRAVSVLIAVQSLFWLLLKFSEVGIDNVSRRMANLSYILWMVGTAVFMTVCAVALV